MPSASLIGTLLAVTLETRQLTTDGLADAWQLLETAFGGSNHADSREIELALVEDGRFYGTYDDALTVGTCGSFSLTMTVPGGPRPVAGVTWVGVAPTHRRQGIASGLMRRQLDDLHAANEPVAALWASEGAIYQRFGYGPGAWEVSLRVPSKSAFTVPVDASGLRLVASPVAADLQPAYNHATAHRGGWQTRDEKWWAYRLHDPEHSRHGASPLVAVVSESRYGVDGYALYATAPKWEHGVPAGEVRVRELVGTSPEITAKLWRYLLDIDLMGTVAPHRVAPDDPVLHLLANPRSARPTMTDNLWVRLVDVAAALSTRCYATPVDLVLDVVDDFCPWNSGRIRLSGDSTGATCAPTADAADLVVRAADLGAAYLGGTTLVARAAAGHVTETRAGALAEASLAFGWPGSAPYCPMVF